MTTLAEIRQKYPQYSDIDDATLADALHKKFYSDMPKDEFDQKIGSKNERTWSDVPGEAASNLGKSAGQFVGNIVKAVTNPVETAKNLGTLAEGVYAKSGHAMPLPLALTKPVYDAYRDPEAKKAAVAAADATGQFYKDRYGSINALKNTLATDPVGAAADASVVLTGGGAALALVPGATGRIGGIVSRTGAALDPIQATANAVRATGRGASHVLGVTTGAGSQPIQTAFQAGRNGNLAFPEHMRGQAPMEHVVDMAGSGIAALKRQRSAAYEAGMQSTKASQAVIDYVPIRQTLSKAFDDITYAGRAKDQAAAQVLQDMAEQVDGFERLPNAAGLSAEGLDALKQALGEIRQRTQPGTMARRTSDQVYQAVKAEITKQVPEYARTMRRYSDASDQINELQKTFSISERASLDTTLRKLQSTMRNNVNTNYGRRTNLLNELAAIEPDLPNALAGQALNSATPRGLQGIAASGAGISSLLTNPAGLAALPAFSPRVVGETAYAAGRGAAIAEDLIRRVGGGRRAHQALLALYYGGEISQDDMAEGVATIRQNLESE